MERLLVAARLAAAQQHYLGAATIFGLAEQINNRLDYMVAGPRRLVVDSALARDALEPAVFAAASTLIIIVCLTGTISSLPALRC